MPADILSTERFQARIQLVAVGMDFRQIEAAEHILVGGLAFYQKERGIIIVERLGENFEVAAIRRLLGFTRTGVKT